MVRSGPVPATLVLLAIMFVCAAPAVAGPELWRAEWPLTDFSRSAVDFGEIRSGGPPKDGIPPIDRPQFAPVGAITDLAADEPVIGIHLDGVWKAYPLRILMWHEIVNDRLADVPIAVTFCPLCNAAIVFDRRLDGQVLDFGTTGKLRHSDLVMWDRQTESWWQQFLGEGIVGTMTGKRLKVLASRLESFAAFRARAPDHALVLVPNNPQFRPYGANPYAGYDGLARPWLYDGSIPEGIGALERVVSLADRKAAWTLSLLREKGSQQVGNGVVIGWTAGQNSALDHAQIAEGRDVGNITARRDGQDIVYFVDFAFAFHAFHPDAPIHDRAP